MKHLLGPGLERVVLAAFLAPATACAGAGDERIEPAGPAAPAPAESGDATSDVQTLAAEALSLMEAAQTEFAAGQLTADSAVRQSEIVERLKKLAELVEQQSSAVSAGRQTPQAGDALQTTTAGDGEVAASRELDAAESNESATGESTAPTGERKSVRDMATSVWGHLPPRERDRMQSRFSERFLPQYDRLVRQYYEALASEGLSDD